MSAPPMIDGTTDDRADFDDEVRAMLARRAADIGPDDLTPGLPAGVRIPLVDERPARRRLPVRWAAAAAVVALVAGGLLVATRDDTPERTATTDTTEAPAPPRPVDAPPIEGLPVGLTSAGLLPLWTDPPGEEAQAQDDGGRSNAPLAFVHYLEARFPEAVASTAEHTVVDGFPAWSRLEFRLSAPGEGTPESDAAVAYLWWSGEAWSVMAVLSTVHDLGGLEVDRDRVVGSIHGDGPRRAAGLGRRVEDLRIDRWQDDLATVGESSGGDVAVVVDAALPDGPTTLLVAPVEVDPERPSPFSELAFDPAARPEPGAPTAPTIPGRGQELPGTEVVGISVDTPFARAVEAALPDDQQLVAAQHRYDGNGLDLVELSSVVDRVGYDVAVFRAFSDDEFETAPTSTDWGRYWLGAVQGHTTVYAESDAGVALMVASAHPSAPASHDLLLDTAEALVTTPEVVAVAHGADPSGDLVTDPSAEVASLLPPGVDVADLAPIEFARVAGDEGPVDPDNPAGVADAYLASRLPGGVPTMTIPVVGPDQTMTTIEWQSGRVEGWGPGEASGTVVLRRDDDGVWAVVAALSDAFDLSGVAVVDGWPTGEVRSSWPGEWWATAVAGDELNSQQMLNLLAYMRSLQEDGGPVTSGPPGALPGRPPALDPGLVTLYAVGDALADEAAGPFVELTVAS